MPNKCKFFQYCVANSEKFGYTCLGGEDYENKEGLLEAWPDLICLDWDVEVIPPPEQD